MRFSLTFLLLAIPLAAQQRPTSPPIPRQDRMRFPPEIIAPQDLVRDIARIAPAQVSVGFENDRTRVLRVKLSAGEALPTHDDRAGLLVCLTGCHLRFTSPEGKTEELILKNGEIQWLPEARRITRNMGPGALEMLYLESKRPQS